MMTQAHEQSFNLQSVQLYPAKLLVQTRSFQNHYQQLSSGAGMKPSLQP